MGVLRSSALVRVVQHLPALVEVLHSPAFVVGEYQYHRVLIRSGKR